MLLRSKKPLNLSFRSKPTNHARVIIPVDFSETSLNAARYTATMLAGKEDTQAVLYHYYDTHDDYDICQNYQESLKKEFYKAGVKSVECEHEMGGDLIENISRLAYSIRASLVVMGITGKSAIRQVMFGSNTLKLIDKNLYPVMIIPPDAVYKGVVNVAFATDFKNVELSTPSQLIDSVLSLFNPKMNIAQYDYGQIYIPEEPNLNLSEQEIKIQSYQTLTFTYPDGPRDAESLMVDPANKDICIISKREKNVGLFKISYPYPNEKIVAKKVTDLPYTYIVTGDIASDRSAVVIKDYNSIYHFSLVKDQKIEEALLAKPYLPPYIREPQGESICWSSDSKSFFTLSEESLGKIQPVLYRMAIGGETRDYVTALVINEFGNVGNWAEKNRIGYTTFVHLSQKPEVYELIRKAVQEVNESLPPAGRVRRFVLMHKEFDADEAEMTRTRKLRRGFLVERYADIIEAMYKGAESIQVRARVKYQDGSEGFIETSLRIATPKRHYELAITSSVCEYRNFEWWRDCPDCIRAGIDFQVVRDF